MWFYYTFFTLGIFLFYIIFGFSDDDKLKMRKQVVDDQKRIYRYEAISSDGKDPASQGSSGADERAPWEQLLSQTDVDEDESLIEQAIDVIQNSQRASASLLQRRLRIGYPRAARLLDSLEEMGVVGPALGGGRERDVLIAPEDD